MRIRALACAVAISMAALVGAGVAPASASPRSHLVFMTDAQYVAAFSARYGHAPKGVDTNTSVQAGTATVSPNYVPPGGGTPEWWNIQAETSDYSGHDIPLREGDADFGYKHIVAKHGVTNVGLIMAVFHQHVTDLMVNGSKITYKGEIVNNQTLYEVAKVTGVITTSNFSRAYYENTPDGKMIGVLTFFCNDDDTKLCPPWVNTANY